MEGYFAIDVKSRREQWRIILQPLDKNGEVMTKGETFRCWIKSLRYAKGAVVKDERLISAGSQTLTFTDVPQLIKKHTDVNKIMTNVYLIP